MLSPSNFKDSKSIKVDLLPTQKNITVVYQPNTGEVLVNVLPTQRRLTFDKFNSIYPNCKLVTRVESFIREQIEINLKRLLN